MWFSMTISTIAIGAALFASGCNEHNRPESTLGSMLEHSLAVASIAQAEPNVGGAAANKRAGEGAKPGRCASS